MLIFGGQKNTRPIDTKILWLTIGSFFEIIEERALAARQLTREGQTPQILGYETKEKLADIFATTGEASATLKSKTWDNIIESLKSRFEPFMRENNTIGNINQALADTLIHETSKGIAAEEILRLAEKIGHTYDHVSARDIVDERNKCIVILKTLVDLHDKNMPFSELRDQRIAIHNIMKEIKDIVNGPALQEKIICIADTIFSNQHYTEKTNHLI